MAGKSDPKSAGGDLTRCRRTHASGGAAGEADAASHDGAVRWRAAFDAVRDLIFLVDRDWRVLEANGAAAAFFQLSGDQIRGRSCHHLLFGTDEKNDQCPLARAAHTGRHEEEEVYDESRNAWHRVAVDPVLDGGVLGGMYVCTVRNITERKRVEEALAASELLKRDILSSLSTHLAVMDRRGQIIAVNDAWRRFCRQNHGDESVTCIGANYLAVVQRSARAGDQGAQQVLAGIQSVLAGATSRFTMEYACASPDETLWFLMTVTPLQRSQGGVVIEHANITELKRMQGSLEGALEEIRRLKDRFEAENTYLREEAQHLEGFGDIVGKSDALQRVLAQVSRVAPTDASVLLLGQTGTGKDLLARAIHARSARKDKPFVAINCAALPSSLIEGELFGHEKGAFTGAVGLQVGRFELADGGTLLLDEVGELAPELQAKLLRVLQEGTFERLGSSRTQQVDVRILAATNRDLQEAVRQGTFRADLYYRLNVFPIHVPPLTARREDIPLLVWYLVSRKQRRLNRQIEQISPRTMKSLLEYDWPGNIRELENVIERAMIVSTGPVLEIEEPVALRRGGGASQTLEDADRSHILSVLEACGWRVKGAGNAAERLGLKPSTLYFRMKKLGISKGA